MKKSIDIIGPYPPPYGGISIHIFRLADILSENGIDYRIYNHGFSTAKHVIPTNKSWIWYFKYFFGKKASLIHFHQFFSFHYVYFFFLSHFTTSKLIVTIHEEKIIHQHKLIQSFLLFFIRHTKFAKLVSVSSQLSSFLKEKRIKSIWLPAYVPPKANTVIATVPALDKEIFLYSIWKLDKTVAQKVYNIELAFKLLSDLKSTHHMLFLIGSNSESDHDYLNSLISRFSVGDSITVMYEKQLVDYLPNCKFLLRTNNEDGYGVSLQEALDLEIPAIASDVCVRPKGTILFKRDDLVDLTEKILNISTYWNAHLVEHPRYHEELISIYKEIE